MSIDRDSFQFVSELVRERSAIVVGEGKEYLVEARLTPLCRTEGFADLNELLRALRAKPPALVTRVVEAITTNETSFFRDAHPFEALRDVVLPRVIEVCRAERRNEIQIWCGACSSGQEPLSIAMTVLEHFPELAHWKFQILATDINETILARCRTGLYSQLEVSRGLPDSFLAKYFVQQGTHHKVRDDLLAKIQFRQLNLAAPLPAMPMMDVVFLRNVLIYFSPQTKASILTNVRRVMRPHAVLFLGTVESPSGLCEGFSPRSIGKATCFERSGG